jgi:hypothetical protein
MDMAKRGTLVRTHRDLEVYSKAFDAAMHIFELSKSFPAEEKYSLTDQDSEGVAEHLLEHGGGVAEEAV